MAQLARAPALQAGGHRFESDYLHQTNLRQAPSRASFRFFVFNEVFMIRKATKNDIQTISTLATNVYSSPAYLLEDEFAKHLSNKNCAIFVKEVDGVVVGFAECSLRHDYVEGTSTSPIGYFEGVFVLPEHRKKGFAKELLSACEEWAKEHGCSEFASDCEFCNKTSQSFHLHSGFKEANKIVCFTKKLK